MIKKHIKVFESSVNSDDYRLQYYYFYIISSKSNFELQINSPDIIPINYFKYKETYYLIFWAKKDFYELNIEHNDNLYITYLLVKTEDSYVLDVTNKGKKPFSNIENIKIQQYLDLRKFMKYRLPVILSSIWLNILASNKLLYYQYFIEKGIILNTDIKNMTFTEINDIIKTNKNLIIKTPYSSASACVTLFNKLNQNCFTGEGVIVSIKNKSIEKYELKFHTFKGKILYCMVKGDIPFTFNNKFNIVENDLYTPNNAEEIKKRLIYIKKYTNEIKNKCKIVYDLTNKFIILMKYKLKYELKNYIIPLNLDEKIFLGFFNTSKKEILKNKIKNNSDNTLLKEYLDFLELPNDKIEKKLNVSYKKKKYSDYYLRIDLMLPDYDKYNNISLIEIEPYACGKGFVLNIKNAMNFFESTIKPDSAQSIVFTKYFQKLLKINTKFNWEKL